MDDDGSHSLLGSYKNAIGKLFGGKRHTGLAVGLMDAEDTLVASDGDVDVDTEFLYRCGADSFAVGLSDLDERAAANGGAE